MTSGEDREEGDFREGNWGVTERSLEGSGLDLSREGVRFGRVSRDTGWVREPGHEMGVRYLLDKVTFRSVRGGSGGPGGGWRRGGPTTV